MIQYSDELLEYLGGPHLAALTVCSAEALPEFPDYLRPVMINFITGSKFKLPALNHLYLALVRQANIAARRYESGRTHLSSYVNRLPSERSLNEYFKAIEDFENCLSAVWKAIELEIQARKTLLPNNHEDLMVFEKGDGSDVQRINRLHNLGKHWSADQAVSGSAPVWITNFGLACIDATVEFRELRENIISLFDICSQVHLEIPKKKLELLQPASTVDSAVEFR